MLSAILPKHDTSKNDDVRSALGSHTTNSTSSMSVTSRLPEGRGTNAPPSFFADEAFSTAMVYRKPLELKAGRRHGNQQIGQAVNWAVGADAEVGCQHQLDC